MTEIKDIAKGEIGNALTSTASNHIVAVANEIYDEELKGYQSEINNETKESLNKLAQKTDEISKEIIGTKDESINIEDNDGNTVFHLGKEGLDAKNVKSNGSNVITDRVVTVAKDEGGDFTSLTEAIDYAYTNNLKHIVVNAGVYDIIQEFKAFYGNGFFDNFTATSSNVGLVLKNNIVIEFTRGAKILCNYTGGNVYVRQRFSPFNSGVHGFTIVGLDIESSNVRYCFHDERAWSEDTYFNKFINCRFKSDNSHSDQTFRACIGGGLGINGNILIESCEFTSVGLTTPRGICTYHNTTADKGKSFVVIKDCYFNGFGTVYFHWAGTSTDISTMIVSGCTFVKSLPLPVSGEGDYTIQNVELIQFNNSIVGEIDSMIEEIDKKADKSYVDSKVIPTQKTRNTSESIDITNDSGKVMTSISIGGKSSDTSEEQEWSNDDMTEPYVKIGSYGIKAKEFLDINGKPALQKVNKYFDNEKISPISTISPVVYEADSQSTSNYIVNAVTYPNGEMIICRRGGIVAKVANDGTETTLMTIAGASDWRGVWMDSKLNVYVSPHASVDGSMQMSDRGLYKLAYGASSFTKVISLFNPASSDVYETQENDDTIWTMCEDADGYLYGGVYCHTKRYAARIYRSVDGGNTWVDFYDFKNILPTGRHVHCIIYNQYNNALYAIIGEINTVLKSIDHCATWTNLHVACEGDKGTSMLAVPDGIIIGSDGAYELTMSKLLADDKTVKTCGRVWANTCFGTRQSDVTGWIYAFGKIDSSVNNTMYMPPIEAITDENALNDWIASNPANFQDWIKYNNRIKSLYPDDAIRPQHFAILVSKDNGDSWEVAYRENVSSSAANGIWTVGQFRNGECLCGRFVGGRVQKPLIISDGKHIYDADGNIVNEFFNKIK